MNADTEFFDQRGPLVFSASLHLMILVAWAVFMLVQPEKKPEELVFELQFGGAEAPPNSNRMEPVTFAPKQVDQSKIQEEIDKRAADKPKPIEAPRPIVDEAPVVKPEPVKPPPKPVAVPKEAPPPPKQISYDVYNKTNPVKVTNVPKPSPKTQAVDISKAVNDMTKNIQDLRNSNLPTTLTQGKSQAQVNELASYYARLKQAIMQAMEKHPLSSRQLEAVIQFDLAPNGRLSNVQVSSGSGDAGFDQKAVAAFKRVGFFEPPPGFSKTETLTITVVQAER